MESKYSRIQCGELNVTHTYRQVDPCWNLWEVKCIGHLGENNRNNRVNIASISHPHFTTYSANSMRPDPFSMKYTVYFCSVQYLHN